MSDFTLGFLPEELTVALSRFSDFTAALIYDDGDPATVNAWPVDAVIELRFYANSTATSSSTTWSATIDGDRASWHETATTVADLLAAGDTYARLFYSTPDLGQMEWAVGPVRDVG